MRWGWIYSGFSSRGGRGFGVGSRFRGHDGFRVFGFSGFRVRVRPREDMCVLVFLDLSMQIKKVDKGPMGWHDWAVARQAGGLARTENFRIFAGRV
jgi:hypothetical protein